MSGLWEYIKIAIMNLKSNKGRSILTMLGIIIGISSVIMVISIGNGVTDQVNGELNDLAGGQLYLSIDSKLNDEMIELTNEDFDAIEEKIPHVKGVTPQYSLWGASAIGRKGSFDASVSAGTQGMEYVNNNKVIHGHYFTENDYYAGNKVCVISETDAIKLFGTTDVVGMDIEISMYGVSQDMTIVGIRETPAASMLGFTDTSRVSVEIPISTLGGSFGFYVEGFDGCYIVADSAAHANDVAKKVLSLMEGRYNVRGKGIFTMENFNDSMSQINSVLGYITVFVVFVAAISLLVGGIGVMNIMLVSVTERTREIGIRKSLGARTSSIMTQFLSESAIISLTGGVIGIVIGVLGAILICMALGMTARVTPGTVIGATFFSSAVGIFFGIYPAKKAAGLSPIEALRHE